MKAMDPHRRAILAAMLAVTQLRFPMPLAHKILHVKRSPGLRAQDAVLHLAAEHIQNEEQEEIFEDEACVWSRELANMTPELFAQTFPNHLKAYEAAQ